jgi:hypothetical protein
MDAKSRILISRRLSELLDRRGIIHVILRRIILIYLASHGIFEANIDHFATASTASPTSSAVGICLWLFWNSVYFFAPRLPRRVISLPRASNSSSNPIASTICAASIVTRVQASACVIVYFGRFL